MPYIKWNEGRTNYEIWQGPSLGLEAMTVKGYERVDALPKRITAEPELETLVFSKYKVAQKLMELELWESLKASLTEPQKDFLYLAQDFSLTDSNFRLIYKQLKTQIPDIDVMLRGCVLNGETI